MAALALGIFSFQGTLTLFQNINTDLANLLPESYSSVQLIERVRSKLAGSGNLWVILEGKSRAQILPVLDELVVQLKKHPEVNEVDFKKPGYDFFDKHKLLYLSLAELTDIRDRIDRKIQREKLSNFYISFDDESEPESFEAMLARYKEDYSAGVRSAYYESDDGQVFLINVKPKGEGGDFKYAGQFYQQIQGLVSQMSSLQQEGLQVYYAGSIRTRVDEYASLMNDLKVAGIVAGLGVLILLLLVLRGVRPILMVLGPLVIGMIYTFGIASWFIDGLNTVTAFMFSIMMGLGIDFGIHMVSRFLEERHAGGTREQALFEVLYHVGRASWTSAITTATAFFLLLIVDFKGFAEFGLIAGIGIITVFVSYWLLLPAWTCFLELVGPMKRQPVDFLKILRRFSTMPSPKLILSITGLITLLCIALLPGMGFEYDYGKLRAELPQAELARAKEQRVRQRRPNPAVVFLNNKQEAEAVKEAIDELKQEEESVLDRFASIYSLVPDEQLEKQAVMAEIDDLLADEVVQGLVKEKDKKDIAEFREALNTSNVTMQDVPALVKERFIGNPAIPGTVGLIIPKAGIELHDGRMAMKFADEIQVIQTKQGVFESSSDSIIFANVLKVMLEETRIAVPLAFMGVFMLLIFDLRRLRKVLIVVIPWLSGVLWMVGCIVLFDLRLNFYNVFIPAAVFGMGIDYGVHLFHRYEEDPEDIIGALQSAGRAIIIAGLTTMVGFAGLAMANHRGLQSMGWLAICGIAGCMLCSLTMLPALLAVSHNKKSGT